MQDAEPIEEDLQQVGDQINKIHQAVCVPAEALIVPAMDRGLERWEVAFGFLYAAFHVAEALEDDWEKVEVARMLAKHTKLLRDRLIEHVFEERKKSRDQQIPGADEFMDT